MSLYIASTNSRLLYNKILDRELDFDSIQNSQLEQIFHFPLLLEDYIWLFQSIDILMFENYFCRLIESNNVVLNKDIISHFLKYSMLNIIWTYEEYNLQPYRGTDVFIKRMLLAYGENSNNTVNDPCEKLAKGHTIYDIDIGVSRFIEHKYALFWGLL